MRIEPLGLIDVARLSASLTGRPLGENPGFGFGLLRAVDVYSGDLDESAFLAMAALAEYAGRHQPTWDGEMMGAAMVAGALCDYDGAADADDLAPVFLRQKCSHLRAVGMALERLLSRRRVYDRKHVETWAGVSMFFALRSAKMVAIVPAVFRFMLEPVDETQLCQNLRGADNANASE